MLNKKQARYARLSARACHAWCRVQQLRDEMHTAYAANDAAWLGLEWDHTLAQSEYVALERRARKAHARLVG